MNFSINKETCEKNGLSMGTALYMASVYFNSAITKTNFIDLCKKGLIEYDGFTVSNVPINPRLSIAGIELMETIFLNSEFPPKESKEDRFILLADALRELYPKGKKEGTAYMWRDSTSVISKRLKAFTKKYGDFTDEQILEATKRYVNSFNGDHRYMQLLKYFISKQSVIDGSIEDSSQLLSYIQNEDATSMNEEDWMTTLR